MVAKAEIHVHIEGTAEPALVRRYAQRHDIDLSGVFGPDGEYSWSDFREFIACYDRSSTVFRTEEALFDLAHDYASRSAAAGVRYLEVFISPDHAASAGLSYRSYVDGLDTGFAAAEAEHGIITRMIVVGVRHLGADAVERAAHLAAGDPHYRVTGFGMAGDERSGHPADFVKAFAIAQEAGLGLTVHAGELAGADSVRAALDALPVTRIGHGVRAIEDPALVRRLAEEAITLEVCPGSNIALGLYPDRQAHPLADLMRAGIPVTLNSDDPPFFGTSIEHEYAKTADSLGADTETLSNFTANALSAAFVEPALAKSLLAEIKAKPGSLNF
ncbi:MAG: adenosine deaminase [Pseudomonadota bacterium]